MTFFNTRDLMSRYKCCRTTINNWMNKQENPLPRPQQTRGRNYNLWPEPVILEWEKREFALGDDKGEAA